MFVFIPFSITEIQTKLGCMCVCVCVCVCLSLSVLSSFRPSLLFQFSLHVPEIVYFSSDGPKEVSSFTLHSFNPSLKLGSQGLLNSSLIPLSQAPEFQNFPGLSPSLPA